jgi:hypothetical protein
MRRGGRDEGKRKESTDDKRGERGKERIKKTVKGENDSKKEIRRQTLQCWSGKEKILQI